MTITLDAFMDYVGILGYALLIAIVIFAAVVYIIEWRERK